MKYLAIYHNKKKYPISLMCKFFEVSRSGYYDFIKRMEQPDKDEKIASFIQKCQERSHKTYGYRRVKIWLLREIRLVVNHKAILRIMNKYGLLAEIRRRKYKRMGEHLLKSECIYRIKPKTFDEARQLIDDYIDFYNNERIQLKTKLTPFEKRRQSA